jgi:hypothetical protein
MHEYNQREVDNIPDAEGIYISAFMTVEALKLETAAILD